MADDIPTPLSGSDLVPRLLAYEIAKTCEKEEIQTLMVFIVDSEGVFDMRISDGITAADISFAGTWLHAESVRLSLDPMADDPEIEDEE